MKTTERQRYIAGVFVRRQFRTRLSMLGITTYTEHKGFIDSEFIVDTTPEAHKVLQLWIDWVNGVID